MQETLKILESVNQFYSQSFNQLVVLTVAVLAFAGVIMPITISLYQKRLFRLEHEEIKLSLKSELNEELKLAIAQIGKEYESKEANYESRILHLEKKLERSAAASIGGNLHIQGNIQLKEENYLAAFNSLTRAATQHIKADNEVNLKRALRLIIEKCLPTLNKVQLEKDETNSVHYEDLMSCLTEYNMNDRYTDELRLLKTKYKQALSRLEKA